MKKIVLFLATAIFAFASCNGDDDNKEYSLSSEYLKGTWKETLPAANYILHFGTNTAKLTSRDGSNSQNYNYTIEDSLLKPTVPGSTFNGSWKIEIVNRNTFKLTSLYIQYACDGCKPVISTFKKQ